MKILFLGKDVRYITLIDNLKNKNKIYLSGYEEIPNTKIRTNEEFDFFDLIVLPMKGPEEKELYDLKKYKGKIYTGLKKGLENAESFLDDEEIVNQNSEISKDGIIDKIKTREKKNITILGYGRIGKLLYQELKDKYNVYVGIKTLKNQKIDNYFYTIDKSSTKFILKSSDIIINTVPDHILDEDTLYNIKGYFLDIASYPYAIDQKKKDLYPFEYELYSSIPSKYDPKKAGHILLKKFKEEL